MRSIYNNLPKFRIGMLASNLIRIPPFPPEKYVPPGWSGAPEQVVHQITEELVRRGYDVTLFASGNSSTKAKLESAHPISSYEDPDIGIARHKEYEIKLIEKAYSQVENFDIIHSHFDIESAPYAAKSSIPTISTLHSRLDGEVKEGLMPYRKTQFYASISNNQRKSMPDLQYVITAYNGIDIKKIPFSEEKKNYLIFVGRLVESKGVAEAIKIAKQSHMRLILLGSHKEKDPYWKEKIQPEINRNQIEYLGFLSREKVFYYLSRAKGLIFPLRAEEPFGLVAIEAMAAGTPVITFNRGSMPEIVKNKETGFLCKNLGEMVDATERLLDIDPRACRARVEKFFTVEKVVDRYERAYATILKEK